MIGSPVLTVLMGKIDLEYYQVKQINVNEIDISYVKDVPLNEADIYFISNSFYDHVGKIKINFKKVSPVDLSTVNKHKFIINEVCR
jgi:phenylacetate-CoA ligase